jgi:hypothetical protein
MDPCIPIFFSLQKKPSHRLLLLPLRKPTKLKIKAKNPTSNPTPPNKKPTAAQSPLVEGLAHNHLQQQLQAKQVGVGVKRNENVIEEGEHR